MARQQKLKVFRTAIGFHDAYVAGPSRKAALAAWGTETDLFARGVAELVTDEELSREPLQHPGTVIKRLRGTAEEQVAALPADPPRQKAPAAKAPNGAKREAASSAKPRPKPMARPSREKLEAVEQALLEMTDRQKQEVAAISERQRALDQERRALQATHERERDAAERAVGKERELYTERTLLFRSQK